MKLTEQFRKNLNDLDYLLSDDFKHNNHVDHYRYQLVLAIKTHAGDEYDSLEDLWELATLSLTELEAHVKNIKEYMEKHYNL
jgi:hypothetical protein